MVAIFFLISLVSHGRNQWPGNLSPMSPSVRGHLTVRWQQMGLVMILEWHCLTFCVKFGINLIIFLDYARFLVAFSFSLLWYVLFLQFVEYLLLLISVYYLFHYFFGSPFLSLLLFDLTDHVGYVCHLSFIFQFWKLKKFNL